MMSILKEAGQGLSGLIPQDAKTLGKDLFGNFGNIFGTKPEWADWRANQRSFEDTSTPVYGQNNQMDRREPSWWNTGGESQPVEDGDCVKKRMPSQTERSVELSKDLKRRGWTWRGPTTLYAFMQSMGVVNDHVAKCEIREMGERERKKLFLT